MLKLTFIIIFSVLFVLMYSYIFYDVLMIFIKADKMEKLEKNRKNNKKTIEKLF